jgi:SAM-dependent methyltransferase
MMKQARMPKGPLGLLFTWGMNIGHAELTNWGLGHISIGNHYKILDVGCGGGATTRKLARIASSGKVYGVDLSEKSVEISRRANKDLIKAGRVEIRHGSVSCLPFPDGVFDLAIAVETHYFWPNLVTDMQEIRRVLKSDGKLVVMGEAYMGGKHDDRNLMWMELGNMIILSINELSQSFAAAGYQDVKLIEEYDRGWICIMGKNPLCSS